jgi:hypothetical protein
MRGMIEKRLFVTPKRLRFHANTMIEGRKLQGHVEHGIAAVLELIADAIERDEPIHFKE